MPEIIILSGIPNAGKSTFREELEHSHLSICRDDIRMGLYGEGYKHNRDGENKVTMWVNRQFDMYTAMKADIIIDQTNCKEAYIKEWIDRKPENYTIKIKFFDCSLYKAYIRNILRWIWKGKYIPVSVIQNMHKNYQKLDKKKYLKYIC